MNRNKSSNSSDDFAFKSRSLDIDIPDPPYNEPTQNGQCAPPKELPVSFSGRGEVKGFLFRQIAKSAAGYLYEVSTPYGLHHFEVFKKSENTRFGCISYPTAKRFGLIAKTCRTYKEAINQFNDLK
jgi:hypothetical protein